MISRDKIKTDDPASLFKFFGFNKYSLSGLIKNTLWFAKPDSFNDPFDSEVFFSDSFIDDKDNLAKYLNNNALSIGDEPIYTPENVDDEGDAMVKLLRKVRNGIRNCGVVAFSSTPYEILM